MWASSSASAARVIEQVICPWRTRSSISVRETRRQTTDPDRLAVMLSHRPGLVRESADRWAVVSS